VDAGALPYAIDDARYARIHRARSPDCCPTSAAKADDGPTHYWGCVALKVIPHPGIGIARKGSQWVMAANSPRTTRL